MARGRSAWPASLAVLGVCASLAALLFLGAWRSPTHRWAGGSGDPVLFLWFIRWGAHAWAHGTSPFITHHLNFPVGVNLMWNTAVPLASLAVAPVTARWGATVAYDLLATAAVALSTWCAYVMISRYVPRRSAALAGALVYGFSPFMLAEGAGHLHLMLAFTPPLVFLVLDELLVRQRHRPEVTAVALGALVAAQVLISEEVAASEVLVAALAVLLGAAIAKSQSSDALAPPMHHHAAGMGTGHMMHFWAKYLDLTDAQKTQMKGIMEKERPTMKPLMQQVHQLDQQLRQYVEGAYDDAKVQALVSQQAQTLVQAKVQETRIHNELYQLLTPDQQAKMKEFEANRETRMQQHMQGAPSQE